MTKNRKVWSHFNENFQKKVSSSERFDSPDATAVDIHQLNKFLEKGAEPEGLTVGTVKSTVLWDVTLCSPV